MNKLKSVLLIDDDEAVNFIHQKIIEKANCTQKVLAVKSASLALDYLRNNNTSHEEYPDLIFLDINMPAMNGWEFLEQYEKIQLQLTKNPKMFMLTTSTNPDDSLRASKISIIDGFLTKPLSVNGMIDIVNKYFAA